MVMIFSWPRISLPRILWRSLIVSSLSGMGLISGVFPGLSGYYPQLVFNASATAQTVSNEEITNYARSVLTVEPLRQKAFQEIKLMNAGDVPEIVCTENSLNKLTSSKVRSIAVNFCNTYKQIIDSNQLTVERFNQITESQTQDAQLYQRIQNELLRLQKKNP